MLTENTGRHMLDSGGAYGRNWERNQGMTVEDALARPAVTVETWERDGNTVIEFVTVDVFHFLRDRCEFDADLDAQFREFAMSAEYENESWFACLDAWLEDIGAQWEGGEPLVVNTYNGEDALSQVLQYAMFSHPETGDATAAIAIHGGCDVRGGYTAPRMFTLNTYGEYELFDNARLTAVIDEPEPVVDPNQGTLIAQPERGHRQVVIDYDGSSMGAQRENHPYDDSSLDAIDFEFGETPIETPGEGDTSFVIADGPAKGWTVSFHEWPAG
jgi:hypothetical protein